MTVFNVLVGVLLVVISVEVVFELVERTRVYSKLCPVRDKVLRERLT